MRAGAALDTGLIGGRTIDNSQVVREVDPRHSRDLVAVLVLVVGLVGGMGFYAWPHFAAQRTSADTRRLQLERELLMEQNRQLRLEKARLGDLRRVERLALRLGLLAPDAARVVVVERAAAPPAGARLASRGEEQAAR